MEGFGGWVGVFFPLKLTVGRLVACKKSVNPVTKHIHSTYLFEDYDGAETELAIRNGCSWKITTNLEHTLLALGSCEGPGAIGVSFTIL